MARRIALLGMATALVVPVAPAAADSGTLSGKLADGKLPSTTSGRAYVYAIHLPDGRISGATAASRSGAWKLPLEPGPYVITASVVRADKPVVSAIAPIQRVRKGHTTRTTVSLKRRKTPRVRKRVRRGARAAATPSAPVGVRNFTGTGPNAQLGHGLAQMLITELTGTSSGNCEPLVIEEIHRADVLREIALANSGLVDPGSRIRTDRLIESAVYLQGTVDTTATTTAWNLDLVDARTGDRIGGDSGTANGLDIFDATAGIAQRLTDQLCGGDYQVVAVINTMVFASSLVGTGLMNAVVKARPMPGIEPPATWSGQETFTIAAMSYDTGVPECSVTAAPPTGFMKVDIKRSATPGMIEVTWGGQTFGTADMVCQTIGGAVTVPGAAPPLLPFMLTVPTVLILPETGGSQSVSGGAGGYVNNGTITVTRFPRGTL